MIDRAEHIGRYFLRFCAGDTVTLIRRLDRLAGLMGVCGGSGFFAALGVLDLPGVFIVFGVLGMPGILGAFLSLI